MSGIELFDSHDLFMKVIIWQHNINSCYSFLVTNENKGRANLHFEKYDLFKEAFGFQFIKSDYDYKYCYILKERYV